MTKIKKITIEPAPTGQFYMIEVVKGFHKTNSFITEEDLDRMLDVLEQDDLY